MLISEGVELTLVVVGSAVLAASILYVARLRGRVRRAEGAERLAVERRDRFLAEAASDLQAPLEKLRIELASVTQRALTPAKVGGLRHSLDGLTALVAELARLPASMKPLVRDEVDLAELVREVLAEPPFSDRGPSVILRAEPARVFGERARLLNGLRILLWVVRRDVDEVMITVSGDDERARVEIDSRGNRAVVDALEQLPAVAYGLRASTAPPGTTLALKVASEVARTHGGRLAASPRPNHGERFTLDLPVGGHSPGS